MTDTKLAKSKLITQMTTDVQVGMDEVVNVFVSRYEDDLFARKDEISKLLKNEKAALSTLDKSTIESIKSTTSKYDVNIPVLSVTSSIDSCKVIYTDDDKCWSISNDEKAPSELPFSVIIVKLSTDDGDSLTKRIYGELPEDVVKEREVIVDNISRYTDELKDVLSLIKDVSRKERQIRGKISAAKLQEAGYEDLINNTELLQLIEVK